MAEFLLRSDFACDHGRNHPLAAHPRRSAWRSRNIADRRNVARWSMGDRRADRGDRHARRNGRIRGQRKRCGQVPPRRAREITVLSDADVRRQPRRRPTTSHLPRSGLLLGATSPGLADIPLDRGAQRPVVSCTDRTRSGVRVGGHRTGRNRPRYPRLHHQNHDPRKTKIRLRRRTAPRPRRQRCFANRLRRLATFVWVAYR